jgi:hypothetical protein
MRTGREIFFVGILSTGTRVLVEGGGEWEGEGTGVREELGGEEEAAGGVVLDRITGNEASSTARPSRESSIIFPGFFLF